jgi:hypothetical protein
MTILRVLTLAAVLLALAAAGSAARAEQQQQATQDSLVAAWERVQRDDPETVAFEKLGERRYRFKTNRFPFDGELKVLKANVTEPPAGRHEDEELERLSAEPSATGVIEYDLVGLSDEVAKKYEHSFANWRATHTLYFDAERGAWVTPEEHRASTAEKYKEVARTLELRERDKEQAGLWLRLVTLCAPILLLSAFLAWLFKRTGIRNQREYMNAAALHMQRAEEHMQLAQEYMRRNEELLGRIAAAVEGANGSRPQ